MILTPVDPAKVEKMRLAFIERSLLPSYAELAVEFTCPEPTVRKYAAQEGWPGMRSNYLDKQLESANAKSTLLAAVKNDTIVNRKYLNLAIVALDKLTLTLERVSDDKSPSTNAQTVNTCMFAAQNLARALHEVGIVGISKTLDSAGKEANGRWNPEMLQQINVTVQNMTDKSKAEPTPAEPAAPEFSG